MNFNDHFIPSELNPSFACSSILLGNYWCSTAHDESWFWKKWDNMFSSENTSYGWNLRLNYPPKNYAFCLMYTDGGQTKALKKTLEKIGFTAIGPEKAGKTGSTMTLWTIEMSRLLDRQGEFEKESRGVLKREGK